MERIVLELGESTTLTARKGAGGGKWATTGSAAVIESDDLSSSSVKIVGAAVGRVNVFYKVPLSLSREDAVAAKVIGGDHMQKLEDENTDAFAVEVVEKGQKAQPVAGGVGPVVGSRQLDGLVPMTEPQEGPSEKTPYGMNQDNEPVMPTGSMVSPGATNIARQSEDAVAKGLQAAAQDAAAAAAEATRGGATKAGGKSRSRAAAKGGEATKTAASKGTAKAGSKK